MVSELKLDNILTPILAENKRNIDEMAILVYFDQGRIQENSKGRVMNWSGAPTYTQN